MIGTSVIRLGEEVDPLRYPEGIQFESQTRTPAPRCPTSLSKRSTVAVGAPTTSAMTPIELFRLMPTHAHVEDQNRH